MARREALVTGGNGFIGRHMTKALIKRGWVVLNIDIENGSDAISFFERFRDRMDLVVHCAYDVGGRAHIDGTNTALIENVRLDSSMFEWALRTRQKAVMYYSSSAAYPVANQTVYMNGHVLTEDDINFDDIETPDAAYGWAKLNGERMARTAADNGLRVHVLRPFSGYAEDQSLDYPFPSIIRRAEEGDLTVWGPRGQTRDWIHISDVVGASLAAYDGDVREPVNLCTGRGVEMGQLMQMARSEYVSSIRNPLDYEPLKNLSVTYDDTKPTGVFYRVGDPTKMNKFYTAEVTVEEGIERALQGQRT